MALHVVAVEALGKTKTCLTGIALCTANTAPLVITTADLGTQPEQLLFTVSFTTQDGIILTLSAKVVASGRVQAAEAAFSSLASRGWRCGRAERSGRAASEFWVHLLRADAWSSEEAPRRLGHGLEADWAARPDEHWVGARMEAVSAPFGGAPLASLARMVTEGVIVNISAPPGLLLLDAHCIEGSSGGAITMESPTGGDASQGRRLVACVAPPLRSSSNESIAFGLAVPLVFVSEALLDDPMLAKELLDVELAALAPSDRAAAPVQSLTRSLPSVPPLRTLVRRSVALLWLDSGSWASGVVVSSAGHVLTCAHFLTGHSWVEVSPDAAENSDAKSSTAPAKKAPPRPPPKRCRGRVQQLLPDGQFSEMNFDADVLHISEDCLDVALLLIRQPAFRTPAVFVPLAWPSSPSAPSPGLAVWAVGHGLFGPGTPWRGPSVSVGSVTKVAYGEETRRPAVLQTSAAVHRGCSGGALVDASSGELVGLVTTNVKHSDGTVMPHVNHSLPVSLLAPLGDFVEAVAHRTAGPKALSALVEAWARSAADVQEQSIWRLEPEALNLPSRIEERKQQALDRMDSLVAEAEASEAEAKAAGEDRQDAIGGPGDVEHAVPNRPAEFPRDAAAASGQRQLPAETTPRSSL